MKIRIALLMTIALSAFGNVFADVNDYCLNVGQFDRLKVSDNVNVVYRCNPDSTGVVAYRAEDSFADAFILSNNNGKLHVQVSTEDVDLPGLPVLYVYSDFLTEVENSSDFTVTVCSPAPCPKFKAVQIGNGNVVVDDVRATSVQAVLATGHGTLNISGTCQEAVCKMVGTGMIEADRLKAGNVKCKILGGGTIGCWPMTRLSVNGIGSTKIYYKGNPEVSKHGGGKLFQLTLPDEPYAELVHHCWH